MLELLDIEKTEGRSNLTKSKEIKKILEGLLFSSSEPVTLEKMKEIVATLYPVKIRELKKYLDEMNQEYGASGRAFRIDEVGAGYLMRTTEEVAPYISLLHHNRRGEKLSHAATEVLAIIAYRAPITRPEIDALRGVDSSGTVASLIERGLIEGVGRKESPGRPMQYATTSRFLNYFGLKGVEDLKPL